MRFNLRRIEIALGLLLTMAARSVFAVDADWLNSAQTLLENGQAQSAYSLLKNVEDEYIGTTAFDKVFAQAATLAGARNEASLALERLLSLDPNALEARMELAKLYQAMANDQQAKYQFDKILAATSNPSLIQDAQANLKRVEEKLARKRKRPTLDTQIASRPEPVVTAVAPVVAKPAPDITPIMAAARDKLRQGQPQAAYEILMEHEFDGSGNVEFDYLLGVAAIDAGKPDKATLALERVLAVNPNYAGARIDMGRAYMLLGNTSQAREEFDAVLKLNPPDTARQQIEGFIAAIEQRSQSARTTWSGFFGITLGRDSNVNGGPKDSEQFIPLFGQSVLLDANSVEIPSNFLGLSGRIQVNRRANDNVKLYAGLEMDLQRNFQASQFDRFAADLRVGSIFTVANHELELSLVSGKTFVEQRNYRNLTGGAIQWRINVNEVNQFQSIVQFNRLSYPMRETSVFDTDQSVIGVSWLHAFGASRQVLGFAGIYRGKETDVNGNPSGTKDFYGVRAGGQWTIAEKWAVFHTFGVAFSDYDGFDISQQKYREDLHIDWNLGLNYLLWNNWSVRPQINITRHDSNIGLYDFNRREISVTLRRDWR
jgi:outer membrane protein